MLVLPSREATPKLAVQLRTAITEGRYSPGEHLSEQVIAKEFGVSRNTLRESFQVLAEQGLVTRVPNRGASVASPTVADVIDIYRARHVLQVGVLQRATALHPATEQMRQAIAEGRQAEAAEDWFGIGTANMHFHLAMIRHADSPRLEAFFGNVIAELRLVFLRLADPQALHQPFIDRNEAVLAGLDSGDTDRAVAELIGYLEDSQRLVLSTYSRQGLS